jgi:hypothetical protein
MASFSLKAVEDAEDGEDIRVEVATRKQSAPTSQNKKPFFQEKSMPKYLMDFH